MTVAQQRMRTARVNEVKFSRRIECYLPWLETLAVGGLNALHAQVGSEEKLRLELFPQTAGPGALPTARQLDEAALDVKEKQVQAAEDKATRAEGKWKNEAAVTRKQASLAKGQMQVRSSPSLQ